MSLIIEALKRARDDAIRRQAASRGLPLAPIPRMRRRSRWLSFALIPLVAALVVCILLLVDLYSRLPQAPAALENSPGTLSEPTAPVGDPAPTTLAEGDPQTIPAQLPAAADDLGSETPFTPLPPAPREAGPATETVADRGTPPAAAQPARPQRARSQPSPLPEPSAPSRQGREFVGQAKLLDGQLVDLEGIAWSESDPFALLNGQVIGVGELIRSYRVIEIGQNQVVLEQGDDRIVLRLE